VGNQGHCLEKDVMEPRTEDAFSGVESDLSGFVELTVSPSLFYFPVSARDPGMLWMK